MRNEVFPGPLKAVLGTMLTILGGAMADLPILALIGFPLLVLGALFCVQGTLAPLEDRYQEQGSLLSHFLLVCGALAIATACIATAAETGAQFVAAKRGQAAQVDWVLLLAYWLTAPVLLTLGNHLRSSAPAPTVIARAVYWILHFPAVALVITLLGRSGTPLNT